MAALLWSVGLFLAMLILTVADCFRLKVWWHGHRKVADLIFAAILVAAFLLGYFCAVQKVFA